MQLGWMQTAVAPQRAAECRGRGEPDLLRDCRDRAMRVREEAGGDQEPTPGEQVAQGREAGSLQAVRQRPPARAERCRERLGLQSALVIPQAAFQHGVDIGRKGTLHRACDPAARIGCPARASIRAKTRPRSSRPRRAIARHRPRRLSGGRASPPGRDSNRRRLARRGSRVAARESRGASRHHAGREARRARRRRAPRQQSSRATVGRRRRRP